MIIGHKIETVRWEAPKQLHNHNSKDFIMIISGKFLKISRYIQPVLNMYYHDQKVHVKTKGQSSDHSPGE